MSEREPERLGPWFTRHYAALRRQEEGRKAMQELYDSIEWGPAESEPSRCQPARVGREP